jgi:hypothetical protein
VRCECADATAKPRKFLQRRHRQEISTLPDGVFILGRDGRVRRIHADALLPFSPSGYAPPENRPRSGAVEIPTPTPIIRALQAGYRPAIGWQD